MSSNSSASPVKLASDYQSKKPVGSYSWVQKEDEVSITLEIPIQFTSRDAAIVIAPNWIKAGVKGHPPILCGYLFEPIVKDESGWTFDTKDASHNVFEIQLQKASSGEWPLLITKDAPDCEMDGQSEYELALALEAVDVQKALGCLKRAAVKGSVLAQLKLGAWYQLGREQGCPVDRDPEESAWYYMMAADVGNGEAEFMLAKAYQRGEGVTKSFESAKELFMKSALHEHSCTESAAFHLGVLLHTGDETHAPNYPEALTWWTAAAHLNSAAAHYNLGVMYLNGTGVEQDTLQARHHFEAAKRLDPTLSLPDSMDDGLGEQGRGWASQSATSSPVAFNLDELKKVSARAAVSAQSSPATVSRVKSKRVAAAGRSPLGEGGSEGAAGLIAGGVRARSKSGGEKTATLAATAQARSGPEGRRPDEAEREAKPEKSTLATVLDVAGTLAVVGLLVGAFVYHRKHA